MSVDVTFIERYGWLHARAVGENSQANVFGYLERFMLTCMERRCKAVLIEEHLHGPSLNLASIHDIALASGSTAPPPSDLLIAYVDTNPDHAHSRMQFAAMLANFHGTNLRVFHTVEDAIAWLEVAADTHNFRVTPVPVPAM